MDPNEDTRPYAPRRNACRPNLIEEEQQYSTNMIPDNTRIQASGFQEGKACDRFNGYLDTDEWKCGMTAVNEQDQYGYMRDYKRFVYADAGVTDDINAAFKHYQDFIKDNPDSFASFHLGKIVQRINFMATRADSVEKAIQDLIELWISEDKLYQIGGFDGYMYAHRFLQREKKIHTIPRSFNVHQTVEASVRNERTYEHVGSQMLFKIAELRETQQNEVRATIKKEILAQREFFYHELMGRTLTQFTELLLGEFHQIPKKKDRELLRSILGDDRIHLLISAYQENLFRTWRDIERDLNELTGFWGAACPVHPEPSAEMVTPPSETFKIPTPDAVSGKMEEWTQGTAPIEVEKSEEPPLKRREVRDSPRDSKNERAQDPPKQEPPPPAPDPLVFGNDYVMNTWTPEQLVMGCDELFFPKFLRESEYRLKTRNENLQELIRELNSKAESDSRIGGHHDRSWNPRDLKEAMESFNDEIYKDAMNWKSWPTWKKFLSDLEKYPQKFTTIRFDLFNVTEWAIHGDTKATRFHPVILHLHAFAVTKDICCSLAGLNSSIPFDPKKFNPNAWSSCHREFFRSEIERRFALCFFAGLAPFEFQCDRISEANRLHENAYSQKFQSQLTRIRLDAPPNSAKKFTEEYIQEMKKEFLAMEERRPDPDDSKMYKRIWSTPNVKFRQLSYIDPLLDARSAWTLGKSEHPEHREDMKWRSFWREFPTTADGSQILRTEETDFLFWPSRWPPTLSSENDAIELRAVEVPNDFVKEERSDQKGAGKGSWDLRYIPNRGVRHGEGKFEGRTFTGANSTPLGPAGQNASPQDQPEGMLLDLEDPSGTRPPPATPVSHRRPFLNSPGFPQLPPLAKPDEPRAKATEQRPPSGFTPRIATSTNTTPTPTPRVWATWDDVVTGMNLNEQSANELREMDSEIDEIMHLHANKFDEVVQDRDFHERRYALMKRILLQSDDLHTAKARNFVIQIAVERHLQNQFGRSSDGQLGKTEIGPFKMLRQVRNDYEKVYPDFHLSAAIGSTVPEFPRSCFEDELELLDISKAEYREAYEKRDSNMLLFSVPDKVVQQDSPAAEPTRTRSRSPKLQRKHPDPRDPIQLSQSFVVDYIEQEPRIETHEDVKKYKDVPPHREMLMETINDYDLDLDFYDNDMRKYQHGDGAASNPVRAMIEQIKSDMKELERRKSFVQRVINSNLFYEYVNNPDLLEDSQRQVDIPVDTKFEDLKKMRDETEHRLVKLVHEILNILDPVKSPYLKVLGPREKLSETDRKVMEAALHKKRKESVQTEAKLVAYNKRLYDEIHEIMANDQSASAKQRASDAQAAGSPTTPRPRMTPRELT